MKRFLTVFTHTKNVHLIKDVGMVPFILHKQFNYQSTIATYNCDEYSYLNTEVKGLKIAFIPRVFRISTADVFLFLLLNFRKYDILQCYHFEKQSLLILSFFKILKFLTFSRGYTFLKLDAVDRIKEKRLNFITRLVSKQINLITVETKNILNYLNTTNMLARKIEYIPNGFYSSEDKVIDFYEKENLMITVGRIGIFEKNNELLLQGFKDFALVKTDWRLEIIGPIEDEFKVYIENFFKDNPSLRNLIKFTGPIYDRTALKTKYEKAKIFVLTSIEEGFPLVFLEAIRSGCTIVSSRVTSAYDITDNEKYGALFAIGNSKELTEKLLQVTMDEAKLQVDCSKIQKFAYDNYSWKNIAVDINELIIKE